MRIDGGLISAHLWRVSTVFAALSVAPEFRNTRVYARASLKSHGRWWPIAADRYGEYALLLAFLQAPAGSVRRRGRRNKGPRAHKFPGNCVKRKPRRNGAEVPTGPVPNPRVEIGHQTVSVFPGYEKSGVLS